MAVNLTKDIVYRSATAKEKDYSINDGGGGGLYLFVLANGSKLWRFIYTFQGKSKKIALGAYPNTSTELARIKAVDAREKIAKGIDPSEIRKQDKATKQADKNNEDRKMEGLPIIGSFADITQRWLDSIASHNTEGTLFKKKEQAYHLDFPSHWRQAH